ncbi:hypothetical protein [Pseudoalteromonas xiamenensis]|uniref:Uncharacterized protein n=1 Tax=Pseudoalteromonas xiamenensis TaxID=882626 RepID=A0A975HLL1_9GAMM|nr:hypothetical protein [Pseudoalteromonas xiamenensis]QTH72206.1 hypothetical protein J5O05_04800 [Pseudoalteromonas xiamenensis]
MKYLFVLFTLLIGQAFAAEKKPEPPPLNPVWEGEHKMVLVNQASKVFAVSMPTYEKPSDVQIVYKIENKDVAFLNMVRDFDLVTLKTKKFNIENLIRGNEVTVNADVYAGDLDNGGELLYENKSIEFTNKLYARELKDLELASQWQEYDLIEVKENEHIYIHKIQQKPSFNHLIFVDMRGACLQKFRTSSRVPSENELTVKFTHCGGLKPLFYDAERYQE